jgi:hypothetical protein
LADQSSIAFNLARRFSGQIEMQFAGQKFCKYAGKRVQMLRRERGLSQEAFALEVE